MAWNEARTETLRRLLKEKGRSASQMAMFINAEHAGDGLFVTRNGVIGKAYRLNLTLDQRRSQRFAKCVMNAKRKSRNMTKEKVTAVVNAVFVAEPLPPPADGDIGRVSVADIGPGMCRFIPGDPRDATPFCGCETVPGTSWCEHHYRRVFQAPQPVKRTPYVDKSPAYLKATNTKLVVV